MLLWATTGKGLRHLCGHEHEHEHEHGGFSCDLKDGQQHFHENEVLSCDCLVTQLQISSFELPANFFNDPKPPVDPQADLPNYQPLHSTSADYRWPELRGPPTIL